MLKFKIEQKTKELCTLYGCKVEDVRGRCRKKNIVQARHGIWQYLYFDLRLKQCAIAEIYGVDAKSITKAINKIRYE